jgi:hypothetical protein
VSRPASRSSSSAPCAATSSSSRRDDGNSQPERRHLRRRVPTEGRVPSGRRLRGQVQPQDPGGVPRAAEASSAIHEASKLLLEIGGLSSLAFGLKDVTEEAVKAETEQKKLKATVKTAGLSWKAHGKEIDEWLDKTSRASGFVKSDLTASLSNLIRVTGSVTKARKLESEAMDVSRARGTSLASAQQLLARVYAGSFTSLQRLGIPVKAVTAAQDKLRETTKNATADQTAHAKAVDKQATVTKALGLVQDKFGGQSKAFASSTAGSFERAKASWICSRRTSARSSCRSWRRRRTPSPTSPRSCRRSGRRSRIRSPVSSPSSRRRSPTGSRRIAATSTA